VPHFTEKIIKLCLKNIIFRRGGVLFAVLIKPQSDQQTAKIREGKGAVRPFRVFVNVL
jgi:hypothetical protein